MQSNPAKPPKLEVLKTPFCGDLRSKKYYLRDEIITQAEDYHDGSGHTFCYHTQLPIGPDGSRAPHPSIAVPTAPVIARHLSRPNHTSRPSPRPRMKMKTWRFDMKKTLLPLLAILSCSATTVFAGISAGFFGNVPTSRITGDYVEARTASVFCGACHYNSEVINGGRDGLMAWSFNSGIYHDVSIAGVKAIVDVTADQSLGIDDSVRHATLAVDSAASDAQVAAVKALIEEKCGTAIGTILSVTRCADHFYAQRCRRISGRRGGVWVAQCVVSYGRRVLHDTGNGLVQPALADRTSQGGVHRDCEVHGFVYGCPMASAKRGRRGFFTGRFAF